MARWSDIQERFENLLPETKRTIEDASKLAYNEARLSGFPGLHNGPGDAYVHMLWAAEVTRGVVEFRVHHT